MELRDKLGPVLWQFATTKAFDPADFESFLNLLPKEAEGQDAAACGRGPPREFS